MKKVKTYYVGGKQITVEEAGRIMEENKKAMESTDMNDWLKVRPVVVIESEIFTVL